MHITILIFVSIATSALAPTGGASEGMPTALSCKRVANIGCSDDGICIADTMIDRHPITFNFKEKRYHSSFGSGRINQNWELEDGRHAIMAISPPAASEFIFSNDWRSASQEGSSVRYACSPVN